MNFRSIVIFAIVSFTNAAFAAQLTMSCSGVPGMDETKTVTLDPQHPVLEIGKLSSIRLELIFKDSGIMVPFDLIALRANSDSGFVESWSLINSSTGMVTLRIAPELGESVDASCFWKTTL